MSETTLAYGLNAGGFVRMRLPEIRRAIYNDFTEMSGGLVLDESVKSFTGQFVSVFAEREAALWELLEKVYLSRYPATAPDGVSLDYAISYAGVKRLQPVRSRALAYFFGMPGAEIPSGAIVQASVASDAADVPPRFLVETLVRLTKASVVSAYLSVSTPIVPGASYWVEIDAVRYSVTAVAGQTATQIVTALDVLIGNIAAVDADDLVIFRPEPFVVDWSNNLTVNYIVGIGYLVAEEFGPVPAGERTLSKIISPVNGWAAVYNPASAILGQLLETGDDLRVRYSLGVYRLGAGTLPAINANLLQDVPGVTSLRVFENAGDVVDSGGRPPGSVEAIIEGGDDQAIFNKLHEVVAGGIKTFGNTLGYVTAGDGYRHEKRFSRPERRWVWLKIVFTTNSEESIPGDLPGRISKAMLTAGAKFVAGQDLILQKLEAAPFGETAGLRSVRVTAAVTAENAAAPAATAYSAGDVPMSPREKATFDISRISF